MHALIQYWIPSQSTGPSTPKQVRLGISIALSLCVAALAYIPVYAWLGSTLNVTALLLTIAFTLGWLSVLRRTGAFEAFGHLLTLNVVLALIPIAVTSGGIKGPATAWFTLAPVMAFLLLGRRAGLRWLAVSVTVVAVMGGMELMGNTPASAIPESLEGAISLLVFAGLVVIVAVFALLFDATTREALDELAHEKASVEGKVHEATAQSERQRDALERHIEVMSRSIDDFAKGNLKVHIPTEVDNEQLQKLTLQFNRAVHELRSRFGGVLSTADQIGALLVTVQTLADVMVNAAQEQQQQTDNVASAMEEMSTTIEYNAGSAHQLEGQSRNNEALAVSGADVTSRTVGMIREAIRIVQDGAKEVERLGEASTRIATITRVIGGIAEQTNLLALNATIEAARAGEHGKGFAVVASEVQDLAERTAEATQQVERLIQQMQAQTQAVHSLMRHGAEEVVKGIDLADATLNALAEIRTSSEMMINSISQIAVASSQQSDAGAEISRNILVMRDVSLQNVDVLKDLAERIQELAAAEQNLRTHTQGFRL